MRMIRIFLWTAPLVLFVAGCAPTRPDQRPEMASTHYDLGVAYFDAGNYRGAVPEFAKAVELSPSDPVYRNGLGMALMFSRRLDDAIKAFQEAIEVDPRFSEARNNLASAYMLKGDLEKARTILTEVLNDPFYPTPQFAYFNLAKIHEQQGNVEKAVEEYKNALDIQRDYVDAHNNLGILYLRQGKAALAIAEFNEATRLSPKVAVYHLNSGLAYYQAGKRNEARRALEKAIDLDPTGSAAESARKVLEALKR